MQNNARTADAVRAIHPRTKSTELSAHLGKELMQDFGIDLDKLEKKETPKIELALDGEALELFKTQKHWADNGQLLTQELLNSIMRELGENPRASDPALPACPQCGERYCGDGAQPCIECAARCEREIQAKKTQSQQRN